MANASCCDDDDVYLVADDRRFKCSKRKLIASSDYFRAMFTSNFREKDKEAIQLQDVDAEYLETLLQYIQHGTYSINENNALGLLQTASMLQFTDVQEACKKEICEFLSCESCLEIYSISSSLGLLDIAVSARTIALWNFPKIATMPHFLHCSVDTLFDYLSDSALHTGPSGEWTVWEAIALWIEENDLERPDSVMKLLHCLDFKLLSADDISNMLFYSVISDNDEAVQLLESIKRYKNNPSLLSDVCLRNEQVLLGSNNSTCKIHEVELNNRNIYLNSITRKPALVPSAVGFKRQCLKRNKKKKAKTSDDEDEQTADTSSSRSLELLPVLYVFNVATRKVSEEFLLKKLCNGPVLASGFQVCSVGPSVYILGGEFLYGYGNWNDCVWRYSTALKKWIVETSLPEPRRHHMLCVLDSAIYIFGGLGRHRIVLNSVKAYNTESGEWLSCPDMPHSVNNGAACAFQKHILVFTSDRQLFTYNPSNRIWSSIFLKSSSKLGYRAALPWRNFIFLVDYGSNRVYKYSPDEHLVQEYGIFHFPPINVCIVDDKLYNFSHDDMDNHVLEVLDIVDDLPGVCDSKESSFDRNDENKHDESTKDNGKLRVAVAKEMWREGHDGPHIFTTKYPADATFSLGCFPLMKLL